MIGLSKPKLWVPSKPAIIRPDKSLKTGTFPMPVFSPVNDAGAIIFDLTHVDDATDSGAGSSTVYTFASQSLGAADANRYIVVGVQAGIISGGDISSVTVAGVSASQLATGTVVVGQFFVDVWIAAVPSGTTGDVVVDTAGSLQQNCSIGLWRLITGNSTPSATSSDTTTSAGSLSASITIPSGGGAIGYGAHKWQTTATACSWTNMTEDFDAVVETSVHSGALSTTAGTPTVTAAFSGSGTAQGGVLHLIAWGNS